MDAAGKRAGTSKQTGGCSLSACTSSICSDDLIPRSSLSESDAALLRVRCGVSRIDKVCSNCHKNYLVFYSNRFLKCCDPLKVHKKSVTKGLVVISNNFASEHGTTISLIPGQKLCTNCVKRVADGTRPPSPQEGNVEDGNAGAGAGHDVDDGEGGNRADSNLGQGESQQSTGSDVIFPTPPELALIKVNKSLAAVDQSPIEDKRALRSTKYVNEKLGKLQAAVQSKLGRASGSSQRGSDANVNSIVDANYFLEVLSQLKEEFARCDDRRRKLQILSVLPKSFPVNRIIDEFGVSKYFAMLVKRVVKAQGILPVLPARKGRSLRNEVVSAVKEFYKDPENSRELPGKKDFVSVKENGVRVQKQKFLVLSNLKELYLAFKADEKNKDIQIGFSKFCELRPKECVLAGAAGTHCVCVCEYHQNFKLLVEAVSIEEESDGVMKTLNYQDVLQKVMCNESSQNCHLGNCDKCPGVSVVQEMLEVHFDIYSIDNIKFKQWTKTDSCSLEKFTEPKAEFVQRFLGQIPVVLKHDFIAKKQAKFLKKKKEALEEGQCIVIGDFSENYSPVYQDAVQGVHWSDEQVTIHPFIAYHRKDGIVENLNFVAVSDTKDHKNETVYAFQQKLVPFLQENVSGLKHVIYFSDGAKSQYKNRKNVANLRHHYDDFGVTAEWNFFATSHGKGPCDGLAGSKKRLARRESLQGKSIATPLEFFLWAKEKYKDSVHVVYVTKDFIQSTTEKIHSRFSEAPQVSGISEAHAVIPLSQNVVLMKQFSDADSGEYIYFGPPDQVNFEDLHGFVLVKHEVSWAVGFVMDNYPATRELEVSLLSKEQTYIWNFPVCPNIVKIKLEEVISIINVDGTENNMFKLKKDHKKQADKWISERSSKEPKRKRSQEIQSASSRKRR